MFGRSATFGVVALLAAGLVARTMGRTVASMPAGAGMAALVSFHSDCRLFCTYRRDTGQPGLAIARLIVERLLGAGAAVAAAVDDTLFRRWAGKGAASPVRPTRDMIAVLAQAFWHKQIHAAGDAACHGKPLPMPGATITTRLPANAALRTLASPPCPSGS